MADDRIKAAFPRAIIEELRQREERDIAERVDAETSHCLGPITGPTIDASGITLTDEDGTIHISMDEYKRMKKRDEAVRKVVEEMESLEAWAEKAMPPTVTMTAEDLIKIIRGDGARFGRLADRLREVLDATPLTLEQADWFKILDE